jgi:hypothetical protein
LDCEKKLLQVETLASEGQTRKALDMLYLFVDDLLKNGEYGRVDQLFSFVDLDRFGLQMSVGLLTITLKYKEQLPSRQDFYRRVRRWADERGERERLLVGLN